MSIVTRNPNWVPDLAGVEIKERLDRVDLSEANLSDSKLSGTFSHASFWGADLRRAKLSGVIGYACLSRADLRGADLSDCVFTSVIVVGGVNVEDKWLKIDEREHYAPVAFKEAKIDIASKLPHLCNVSDGGWRSLFHPTRCQGATRVECKYSLATRGQTTTLSWPSTHGFVRRALRTKLDKDRDFSAGSRIRDEIFRVMSESQVILVFHSQASVQKPWPEFESASSPPTW